jgi:hypothetical protein
MGNAVTSWKLATKMVGLVPATATFISASALVPSRRAANAALLAAFLALAPTGIFTLSLFQFESPTQAA